MKGGNTSQLMGVGTGTHATLFIGSTHSVPTRETRRPQSLHINSHRMLDSDEPIWYTVRELPVVSYEQAKLNAPGAIVQHDVDNITVLTLLENSDPYPVQRLIEQSGQTPQFVHDLVDRLEEVGMAEIEDDNVIITDKFVEVMRARMSNVDKAVVDIREYMRRHPNPYKSHELAMELCYHHTTIRKAIERLNFRVEEDGLSDGCIILPWSN